MEKMNPLSLVQQNDILRQQFLAMTRPVRRPLPDVTINPAATRNVQFQLQRNGLLTGALITVTTVLTNASAAPAILSTFGLANLVKRLTLTDLSNNVRIDIDGRSLHALNSARQGWLYGAAYNTGIPTGFGANKPIFNAPVSLAAGASTTVTMQYWLPAAYSNTNLRGAIHKSFFNNAVQIGVELVDRPFGPQVAADAPLRPVDSVYLTTTLAGADASGYAAASSVVVSCLESYRDGPAEASQYLPPLDLASTYELKTTSLTTPTANADFAIAYASQRETLASYIIFDNGGTFSDTNLLQSDLQEASSFVRHRMTQPQIALAERQTFMADTPDGTSYFDFRDFPINTITQGAIAMLMRWQQVLPGSRVFHTTESFLENGIAIGNGSIPSLTGA